VSFSNRPNYTLMVVLIGFLGGFGFVLMLLEFPIPPLPAFLQYDAGDVPALIAGLSLGPVAGFFVEVIKCALFFLSGKDEAGWIGTAANFVCGASMVVATSCCYAYLGRAWKGLRPMVGRLLASLVLGSAFMLAATSVANLWFFFPLWGLKGRVAYTFLVSGSIPFNILKALFSSVLAALLYRRIAKPLDRIVLRRGLNAM